MQAAQAGEPIKTVITATLSVIDWPAAMKFYQLAFGAVETYCVPGGGVGRLAVDGAEFWVAEESKPHLNFSPASLGGSSVRMLLLVGDPQQVFSQAIDAGAKAIVPVTEQHGWLIGRLVDPFGHHWEIAREVR
jgi:PhnB protein